MGTMQHHAIVVASCFPEDLVGAHDKASSIFPWVSPISPEVVNGYRSFFIPPDGSKEWWKASGEGDIRRLHFIDWLTNRVYDDGSGPLDWVEISFGELGYRVERKDNDHLEVL